MSSVPALKNWKPRHENVVMLHLGGWNNIAIANYTRMTPERIYQILQTPQAQALIASQMDRIRERFGSDVSDKLLKLTEISVNRVSETLEQDFIPGTDAKKHQDKVALEIMKGKGFLNGADPSAVNHEQKVSVSLLEKFTNALERANEAKSLHTGDNDSEAIEEASFEVIE